MIYRIVIGSKKDIVKFAIKIIIRFADQINIHLINYNQIMKLKVQLYC